MSMFNVVMINHTVTLGILFGLQEEQILDLQV
jgi:hypothetical protein